MPGLEPSTGWHSMAFKCLRISVVTWVPGWGGGFSNLIKLVQSINWSAQSVHWAPCDSKHTATVVQLKSCATPAKELYVRLNIWKPWQENWWGMLIPKEKPRVKLPQSVCLPRSRYPWDVRDVVLSKTIAPCSVRLRRLASGQAAHPCDLIILPFAIQKFAILACQEQLPIICCASQATAVIVANLCRSSWSSSGIEPGKSTHACWPPDWPKAKQTQRLLSELARH